MLNGYNIPGTKKNNSSVIISKHVWPAMREEVLIDSEYSLKLGVLQHARVDCSVM